MLFNSAAYLVFLPVVVAIYWFMPFRYRTAFLLFASYVFYMTWKPIYLVLIVALTAFKLFRRDRYRETEEATQASSNWITGCQYSYSRLL